MTSRFPFRLVLIWICFLARGSYYAVAMPLWEGFDEYAHFARLNQSSLPRSSETVTREVEESFHLAPVPDQLQWIGPWARTHPQWWALPEAERARERAQLRTFPFVWAKEHAQQQYDSYEAQQPPLYYWMIAPLLTVANGTGLLIRVLLARLLSVAIASMSLPFTYLSARKLVSEGVALGAAALLAVSPMFALDTARVANDCLAIALTSLLLYLLTTEQARSSGIGLVLGAALLSKAYLLSLIPGILWIRRRRWRDAAQLLAIALAVGGWWYVRNVFVSGRLSGWEDDAPLRAILINLPQVDWPRAAGAVLKSGLWFGGWSFLTVRPWIYDVLLIVLGGCLLNALRHSRRLAFPAIFVGCFLAGMVYDVGAQFVGHHTSSAPGWYLWAVGGAAAILLGAGAGRFIAPLLLSLAAFDIYTCTFILLPYFAGFAKHGRGFSQGTQSFGALARLDVPLALWVTHVLCTLAIPAIVLKSFDTSTNVTIRQTGLT